jgi:error-prone DNA polymerase
MTPYAELVCASNFSFLRGASSAQDLVLASLLLGHTGLGIADRNTVAGVVRAYAALRELREGGALPPVKRREGSSPGEYTYEPSSLSDETQEAEQLRGLVQQRAQDFKLATGARLIFADGTPDIVVYAENRQGWGRLTRLLTQGNLRSKKGECHLTLDMLLNDARDLLLILMPERHRAGLPRVLHKIHSACPGSLWIGATMPRRGSDRRKLAELKQIADQHGIPLIACNDVLYADPSQRDLQDILTCIREGKTIDSAGRLLQANAERHLKHPDEMVRLFADCPEAVHETHYFLQRIGFSLQQLKYEYPDETVPPGWEAQSWLEELVRRHTPMRYPEGASAKVEALLREELKLIKRLEYARYFLTIHDIVRVANDKGILCQGRGSAANSAVCYVLGITCVDPAEHDLLFARFISEERREPPDIDVDFEHERREEIIQHIYQKYGRHRAGIAATVVSYRPKSAIREVGKAFGLAEDVTAAISGTQWGSWGSDITATQVRQAGLDPDNPVIARAVAFAQRILGFPRHLSQHVGGFILARGRLDELVPIGNAAMQDRTFIEWDKDDIDTLGLMKVDVLALGMLTCIRKAFDLLREHEGLDYDLADVPTGDKATYDMLCRGDSIGVFQVESRAQISMLPRLKPRIFYDLVIQVAIVRPGPIQGNMVHPYLRRRSGHEKVTFPSPSPAHGDAHELREVLGKTMGVPLFQEQAMKLAMVAAKFTDVEANQLRRAMATFRHNGTIHRFEHLMVERMVARGYEKEFAQNCFEQIKGFGSYGFPESHAASFAKLVYISSWIKCHHPHVFACALLNAQPMGFYAPAQIVRDARDHGVEVRAVDVNHSDWDNRLECDGLEMLPQETVTPAKAGTRLLDASDVFQKRSEEIGHVTEKPGPGLCRGDGKEGYSIDKNQTRIKRGKLILRLGFRQADGIHQAEAARLMKARRKPYTSIEDLSTRAKLYGRPMRALADADCFRSINLDRRQALWAVRRLPDDDPLPLFAAADARELAEEPDAFLPDMPLAEHVATDYQTLRLSLKAHPMQMLRPIFQSEGILTCAATSAARDGASVQTAGVVLVRQRPGKGNAIFITLEDETGVTNVVLWARQFEFYRKEIMGSRLMLVTGRVQRSVEGVVHLMAASVTNRTRELDRLWEAAPPPNPPIEQARQDNPHFNAERPRHSHSAGHPRGARVLPKSRDFH